MIIKGKRLRLYCWNPKIYEEFTLLPEIKKEQYGYELLPDQKIYVLRYTNGGFDDTFFHSQIIEINEQGILIDKWYKEGQEFVPWEKDLMNSGKLVSCNLYVEPCECLFEKNIVKDILSGNIIKDVEMKKGNDEHGIWYEHGGRRTSSRFEINLKNFVEINQLTFEMEEEKCTITTG